MTLMIIATINNYIAKQALIKFLLRSTANTKIVFMVVERNEFTISY